MEEASYAQDPSPAQGSGVYLDMRSSSLDVPNEADGIVPSAFGRSANQKFAGWYNPSGNVVYPVNIRTIVQILKWALGGYAFTAGAAGPPVLPNVHEAWGSDSRILPSFAARVGKDQFEHLFRGCVVDSIQLEVEDTLVTCTVELATSVDAKQPLQLKSVVFAALPKERPIPFHGVRATIAGVLQNRKLKNLTLNVNNNADAESGRYLGSRYAGRVTVNERETTVNTEMDFTDMTQIERIWGGTEGPSDEGSIEFPMSLEFFGGRDEGGQDQRLIVELPRVYYTAVETQPEGRSETSQPVQIRALTGEVTLADGTTKVQTDVYARVTNHASAVMAPAA